MELLLNLREVRAKGEDLLEHLGLSFANIQPRKPSQRSVGADSTLSSHDLVRLSWTAAAAATELEGLRDDRPGSRRSARRRGTPSPPGEAAQVRHSARHHATA